MLAAIAAPAAGELRALSLQADNDEFAGPNRHDRWYSSGLRATAVFDADDGGIARRAIDAWCGRAACAADRATLASVSLGQNLYTQADRTRTLPRPDDQPVGAWLYLRAGAIAEGTLRHDSIAVEVGTTGPAALGEPSQNLMHDALGVDRVPTWPYQLRPRTGVALRLDTGRRIPLAQRLDAVGTARIALGTLRTDAAVGIALRWGGALDGTRLPAEAADAIPGLRAPSGWYAFGGTRLTAVAFDGLVEGPAYGYSPAVRARPFVGELFGGIGYRLGRFDLTVLLSRRSGRFSGGAQHDDKLMAQTIGAATIGWRFGR